MQFRKGHRNEIFGTVEYILLRQIWCGNIPLNAQIKRNHFCSYWPQNTRDPEAKITALFSSNCTLKYNHWNEMDKSKQRAVFMINTKKWNCDRTTDFSFFFGPKAMMSKKLVGCCKTLYRYMYFNYFHYLHIITDWQWHEIRSLTLILTLPFNITNIYALPVIFRFFLFLLHFRYHVRIIQPLEATGQYLGPR